MPPIYAVGDIHGHAAKLVEVLSRIDADGGPDAEVVFLGDLIDRGPDSRQVIETLRAGLEQGRNWTVLRGNHDQMLLDFLASTSLDDLYAFTFLDPDNGGPATLASYDVPELTVSNFDSYLDLVRDAVPQTHEAFLGARPLTYETDSLLFVHAGIRPGVPIADQDPEDLLWIRDPFLRHAAPFEKLVVHGHTPVDVPEHRGNRVALDTGAAWDGPLTVGVFEGDRVFTLETDGRIPLDPP